MPEDWATAAMRRPISPRVVGELQHKHFRELGDGRRGLLELSGPKVSGLHHSDSGLGWFYWDRWVQPVKMLAIDISGEHSSFPKFLDGFHASHCFGFHWFKYWLAGP